MKLTREIKKYLLLILFLFKKFIKILRIYEKSYFTRKLTRYNLNRYLYQNRILRFAK